MSTVRHLNSILRSFVSINRYKSYVSSSGIKKPSLKSAPMSDRIVWIDLELTGLDETKDRILEIACIITDVDLNVVAGGPDIVIHETDAILDNMDQWCTATHRESGLTAQCKTSKVSVRAAELEMLQFLRLHIAKGKCPMAGNSIYMDRLFLRKHMPELNDYLHYRIIDVSSIKELAKRWFPKEYTKVPGKSFKHRALDDITETIAELKYYRENIFR